MLFKNFIDNLIKLKLTTKISDQIFMIVLKRSFNLDLFEFILYPDLLCYTKNGKTKHMLCWIEMI